MCTFSEFSFVNSSVKSPENVLTSIINSSTHSVCFKLSSVSMCWLYSLMSGILAATLLQVIRYPLLSWSVLQKKQIKLHWNSLQSKPELSSNSGKKRSFPRGIFRWIYTVKTSLYSTLFLVFEVIFTQFTESLFSGSSQSAFFFNSKSTNISLKT